MCLDAPGKFRRETRRAECETARRARKRAREKVGGESRGRKEGGRAGGLTGREEEVEERDRVWSESPEDGNAVRRQGFRLQFPLSGRQVWNGRAGGYGSWTRGLSVLPVSLYRFIQGIT